MGIHYTAIQIAWKPGYYIAAWLPPLNNPG